MTEKEMQLFAWYHSIPQLVRGGSVRANWCDDGSTFWYRESSASYLVDPKAKEKSKMPGSPPAEWQEDRPHQAKGRIYSQDFKRYIKVEENILWLFDEGKGDGTPLTEEVGEDIQWIASPEGWSPDGSYFFAVRNDVSGVHHLPIIDYTHAEETERKVVYSKSGGGFPKLELAVFDVRSKKKTDVDIGAWEDIYIFPAGFSEATGEIIFLRMTRNAKRLDLMAGDPESGESRVIVTETRETFVGGLDFITGYWRSFFTPVEGTNRFLWLSERDGWRHIYLYDLDGNLIERLTEGEFPVLRVVDADPERGRVFFLANGEKRLYDTNLYSVSMEGGGFRKLTEGPGRHSVQLSPSRLYFIDTYSSVTRPPVSDLRDVEGNLLMNLSKANTSFLEGMGWSPPEEFIVKADDGRTDLYGVLYKPADLDPEKRYPVIDFIYAGPFTTVVPHTFVPTSPLAVRAHAMAQIGFITFIVDCRGTTERGKAFQDASYGRIGQIEIPDHVAALRQLGADRPYMDLDRVGIFGASWGGYFVLRAMLTAPEVFSVGVAAAPGDLTESQAINEPYMGLPQENPEGYAKGSNPAAAKNLEGKLLLVHGTADVNAPVSTTMRMVDALIRENKLHDVAVLPQADHYFRGHYGMYAANVMVSYFKEHLAKE